MARSCFFEANPQASLPRRMLVEGVGTFLLMLVLTGTALVIQQSSPSIPLLPRFTSAIAAAGALTGLVIALGSASGAHFNPLISGIQWLLGERSWRCAAGYALAQASGAVIGGAAGRFLFDGVSAPMTNRALSWILVTSEFVSAMALMTIVLGCSRSAKAEAGPFAIAAWLAAAIIVFPSGSYANPAIVLGSMFAAGPIKLQTTVGAWFVAAELLGVLLAAATISLAYPRSAPEVASQSQDPGRST